MTAGVDRERLRSLLRSCIQCGLCLPHCATYLATGDETRSPRGRLILLDDLLAGRADDELAVLAALDECLGCRACSAACPSGVVHDLLDDGVDLARRGASMGMLERLTPERMPAVRRFGAAAERIVKGVLGSRWRARSDRAPGVVRRAARLLGSRPVAPGRDAELLAELDALTGLDSRGLALPSPSADAGEAALFRGCASAGLLPGVQARFEALLRAAGMTVVAPSGQTCCGALEAHTGRRESAEARYERNAEVLVDALASGAPLVVEAAGCGLELAEHCDAGEVVDAVVLLSRLVLPQPRPVSLRVVVHDPCHARHGLGVVAEPRALLREIPGIEVLEADEAEVCCGSGGGYALIHPDLSEAMGRRKARILAETGAQLAVTSNPGCLGQIRDGSSVQDLGLPVLPLSDLIWYSRLS